MKQSLQRYFKYQPTSGLAGIIVIIVVVIIGAIGFVWLRNQNSQTQVSTPSSPTPTVSEQSQMDTSDWKTYTNEKVGISIDAPNGFSQGEDGIIVGLNSNVRIYVSETHPKNCRGGCPVIENTSKKKVAGINADFLEGYNGEIGGCVADRYVSYVIEKDNSYIVFMLDAANCNNDGKQTSGIVEISEKDLETFNQILSTFRFTE